ncbi:MAG: hypothetical protein JW795_11300 [Chitinivibrionales bacterium]|nr:hypothetical protein [Chitinivibrionales bacterium]
MHQIGEQAVDIDYFKKKLEEVEPAVRRGMVERDHRLSLARQCRLLSLGRTALYYQPQLSANRDFAPHSITH